MLKVDLHLHTKEDPLDVIRHSATALIDRAVALEFDALAITLHDRQLEDSKIDEYARQCGIMLLRGIELTIQRKHVLAINFPTVVERVRTLDDLAALKSHCNGIVVAPHPFFPDRSCLGSSMDDHADLFDAVEWSYFWTRVTNFNARGVRWATERGKPIVGNSDLHDLRQLGRTFTWVEAKRDPDSICDAIRTGRVTFETTPVPPLELARVLGGMALRGRHPASATRVENLATT